MMKASPALEEPFSRRLSMSDDFATSPVTLDRRRPLYELALNMSGGADLRGGVVSWRSVVGRTHLLAGAGRRTLWWGGAGGLRCNHRLNRIAHWTFDRYAHATHVRRNGQFGRLGGHRALPGRVVRGADRVLR